VVKAARADPKLGECVGREAIGGLNRIEPGSTGIGERDGSIETGEAESGVELAPRRRA